jgi:hypothetical protein
MVQLGYSGLRRERSGTDGYPSGYLEARALGKRHGGGVVELDARTGEYRVGGKRVAPPTPAELEAVALELRSREAPSAPAPRQQRTWTVGEMREHLGALEASIAADRARAELAQARARGDERLELLRYGVDRLRESGLTEAEEARQAMLRRLYA